ncbi:MAG: Rrf2 family transcriptional regulator [Desulfovibrio sp.]|jgi:Rrf2 family iron-sulfur cluster assembly transcriptional regulator|nr:Rrf2 family transcriptional regulator [Desulfovibrio sp.]
MHLAVNTRYAIRLIFRLSSADSPVCIADLSEQIGLTTRAGENVHTVLRRHGITEGTIGPGGGIRLRKKLSAISLGHLMKYFADGVNLRDCLLKASDRCPQEKSCAARSEWHGISERLQSFLDNISLADILTIENK